MRAFALVLIAGSLLAACGSGEVSSQAPVAEYADIASETRPMESSTSQDIQQSIIQTANVSLEVDDVHRAIVSITKSVEANDGSVQSRTINRYDNNATASLTIRVPAASLEDFLTTLTDEGTILSSTVDAQDVTVEVIDIEARRSTLEASINRLRDLQRQATSVTDLVAVESELSTRQADLESLTARRDYLVNQVELSTVYIWMDQVSTGAGLTPDFIGGLQRGWDALLTLGAGLITGVGFVLPTALVGLAIAAVIIGVVRARRQRTKREERE